MQGHDYIRATGRLRCPGSCHYRSSGDIREPGHWNAWRNQRWSR